VEEVEGGVKLVFVARARWFVGIVRVQGAPSALEEESLALATHLRLGQPLNEEDLKAAEYRLTQVFAENAYYEARIQHLVRPDPVTQEAQVVFFVTPGKPALLSKIEFEGQTLESPDRLARVAGWRTRRQLTSAKLEKGLSKLRQFYQKRQRLTAAVNVLNRHYDAEHHREELTVHIESGPVVKVRVRGATISTSRKKELLPMYREGTADDFAVQQGKHNLEDYFARKGYFEAKAEAGRKVNANAREVEITYTVDLGSPGSFVGYAFEGNRNIVKEDLEKVLTIQPASFIHDRGIFSQDLLANSTKALMRLYHSRGFLEARVTPHLTSQFQDQPQHLFVTFDVQEGERTKVGKMVIQGAEPGIEKELWSNLLTRPGEPYSPERAQSDRETIRTYFTNQGYLHAAVSWEAAADEPDHAINLMYQITPGPKETIGRVVLMGNHHTRAGVIRRELNFHAEEPVKQSSFVESQRKLYDLGIFNEVQISPQDPEGPPGPKTVLVEVEEARRWTVGYGGGLEVQRLGSNQPEGQFKASPRLSLDITRLNVGGRGQSLTLRGRLSTLEKGGGLSYFIPRFPERPDLHLRLNALVDRSQDVLTFTSEREEVSISLEKKYSPTTLVLGRYTFRNVKALDISNRISPEQIPLASLAARVAMVSLSAISDHRDDPTDATRGSFSVADGGISAGVLGSQANFLRLSGQNATYYRLARHLIFARTTRFAFETPYGGLREVVTKGASGNTQVTLTHDIPLPERFFMGGSESHRGFSINQAGPRDLGTGFPIGGNALFLNSFELRVPLWENRLGIVLFHDAGNAYSSIRRMRLLKLSQSSPSDFDYTVHALGWGFRYKTPVGPLRFDLGYSLNPPRFRVVTSNGSSEVRRLSRFQFFLGIGQTF
jgi:outer membrane protein assembly complex protein YaeT